MAFTFHGQDLSLGTDKDVVSFVVFKVGLDQLSVRAVQRYFVGLFALVSGDISIDAAVFQSLQVASGKVTIISAQLLRQSVSGLLQRFQGRFDFLLVVGVLTDMLRNE